MLGTAGEKVKTKERQRDREVVDFGPLLLGGEDRWKRMMKEKKKEGTTELKEEIDREKELRTRGEKLLRE